MAQTALDYCTMALIKCHAKALQSFDEGTAEAEVAAQLYPLERDALLASYPWNFATAGASLSRLAETPETEFDHAFALPDRFVRAVSAGYSARRPRGLDYEIHENRLHCNADTVFLKYHFRPDESRFPPHFIAALVARLRASFAGPLGANQSMVNDWLAEARDEWRLAKSVDSQQDRPNRFEDFSLVDCRS